MALLFPREEDKDFAATTDAATRSLSAISLETSFVEGVYEKMASVYDSSSACRCTTAGPRPFAAWPSSPTIRFSRSASAPASAFRSTRGKCSVTAIDLSEGMLERARTRVEQYNLRNVRLIQMDATRLKFPDNSFDIVYAPYFISCVPDPLAVTREMRRVCRPGGRLVFLNHFLSDSAIASKLERAIAPLTLHLGFKSDFDLPAFLAQTGLRAASIEKVNVPRIWSLVICDNAE